jgi:hypothetical protein
VSDRVRGLRRVNLGLSSIFVVGQPCGGGVVAVLVVVVVWWCGGGIAVTLV